MSEITVRIEITERDEHQPEKLTVLERTYTPEYRPTDQDEPEPTPAQRVPVLGYVLNRMSAAAAGLHHLEHPPFD